MQYITHVMQYIYNYGKKKCVSDMGSIRELFKRNKDLYGISK